MSDAVGFVGVGNMGGAMAERILQLGGAVVASDAAPSARSRLASAGATIVETPAQVAASCSVVSVVVNTDAQVREAMLGTDGVLTGAAGHTIVAIHSTIHIDTLEQVAAAGEARGVTVLDAAVTGGPDAARRGELAVMLGGDPSAITTVTPALAKYASLVMRMGELGAGMAAKIALMVISFGKLAATYEGLLLARAAGVDVTEFARVVSHSEAQSGLHSFFLHERAKFFGGDGALREIGGHESPKSQKDLHAALELAARVGIRLPLTTVAHDAMPETWGIERPR